MASHKRDEVSHKRARADDDEPAEVDLLAMLDAKSKATLNMKELPAPNKHGKVVYYGYMDGFFCGQPPRPETNWVVDNASLVILRNLGVAT